MPDKVTELFDVDVQTVGLVKRGANRKKWFLMKSQEGNTMAEEQDVLEVLNELEQIEDGELTRGHFDTLVGIVKAWFTREPELDLEVEPKPETVEKSEVEVRLEMLEKAHQDQITKMQGEIEQVRKDASEQVQKADERVTAIEKAKRVGELEPIAKAAGIEVDVLYRLEKSDKDAFDAVTERFKAFEAQLSEAGLWKEIGSSQPGETDPAKKLMAVAAELRKSSPEMDADTAIRTAAAGMQGDYEEYRQTVMTGGK